MEISGSLRRKAINGTLEPESTAWTGRIRARGFNAGLVLWLGPIPDDATVIPLGHHDASFVYIGADPSLRQMAELSVHDQSWDRWVYFGYILESHPRGGDITAYPTSPCTPSRNSTS